MSSFLEQALISTIKDNSGTSLVSGKSKLKRISAEDEDDHDLSEPLSRQFRITARCNFKEDDALRAIKPCTHLETKCKELLRQLDKCLEIVDLKISLYVTACNTVRLKPFPNHIVDETPEGLGALVLINDLIPPVKVLKAVLNGTSSISLNDQAINVVHWLVVMLKQPKLVNMPGDSFRTIFEKVVGAANLTNPDYMLKFMVNNLCSNNLQWQAARGKQATRFAFYGVRVEHIHSLIHLGLYPFQKIAGPLGNGIYLTTDLKSCLENSPPLWVWGKSFLGTKIQTVALVEFIATDKVVCCGNKKSSDLSYNYFVPHNNLIQARYLLVFVHNSRHMQLNALQIFSRKKTIRELWRSVVLFGGYVTLCFVSWKALKNSKSTIWMILRNNLKPFSLFIEPSYKF